MALPAFNRSQNPAERAKNAVLNPNEPHVCKECGSTYFVSRQAEQYSISAYAVRGISVSPQTFYECIGCGDIFTSGNQATTNKGGEREAFQASMELGKAYRAKHNAAQLIKNSASIKELDEVKDSIEHINTILEALTEFVSGETEESEEDVVEVPEEVPNHTHSSEEKITRQRGRQGK